MSEIVEIGKDTVNLTVVDNNITLDVQTSSVSLTAASVGPQGPQGLKGSDGADSTVPGPTGNGISSIVRTSGTGAAGTTDTYTITYSDSATSTFNVVNGANGATGATGAGGALGYYGSFYDTTTQTLTAANTPKVITLNTTAENNGITINSTYKSRITFNYAGTYNIQFSAQVSNNGTSIANFWLRKNGTDLTWTNGEVTTSNQNHHVLPAWNYVLTLAANDYLEFVWMSNDAANTLEAQAATTSPASPAVASMIVTVQQVMYTQVGTYPSGQPGVVHADSSGNLTSSSIVNADIATSAGILPSKISGTAVTQADVGTVSSNMLGASVIQTYVQASSPTVSLGTKYLWWDTSQSSLTLWIEDGT